MTQIEKPTETKRNGIVKLDPGALARLGPLVESLGNTCGQIADEMAQLRKALKTGRLNARKNATTGEYAYTMLRQIFADLLAHESGTSLGEDPEELHQMRVATRRLRATIDLFQPVLSEEFDDLKDELRWVGSTLGEARDLQVQRASLDSLLPESETGSLQPLIDKLEERTRRAQAEVAEMLASPRYRDLVRRMTETLLSGGERTDESAALVRPYAAQALSQRYQTVRKNASRLDVDSPDPELHKVRIKIKRLRYAVETFQPLFPKRLGYVRRETKALQDLLGEHQDHVAARAWMRELALQEAATLPVETLVQMGELIERRRHEMLRVRLLWPGAYTRLRKRWRHIKRDLKSAKDAT